MVVSTSKTVSLGGFRGRAMSAGGESEIYGVVSQKVSRACASVWPSRLEPRHVRGEEGR